MSRRRSRPRAYLALARISNLPTVWTNVLAGMALAGSAISGAAFAALAASISLLYAGGMFLNDAFDHRLDAVDRPDRPIPAGEVTRREAFGAGFSLIGLGVLGVGVAGGVTAAVWAVALAACIIYYDWRHKHDPVGPLVMGVCRGLVYVIAAVTVADSLTSLVIAWASLLAAYVTAVTLVAKYGGDRWGWSIAWLIAGISIVDAAAIASRGLPGVALIGLAGLALTIIAQRWVRGT